MTDTPELVRHNPLTKEEQDRIDRAVPQMLQQIDPKVLIQFLKAGGANAQVNVVTIGNYYAESSANKNGEKPPDLQEANKKLQEENEHLLRKLEVQRNFNLLDWLEGLPKPRHEYMIREVVVALKDRFETQKECCDFLGSTPRVFSYWMKQFNIPGYKPRRKRKTDREEKPC